ncbi:MAG: hypothetical protein R6U31_03475 [bacterium]
MINIINRTQADNRIIEDTVVNILRYSSLSADNDIKIFYCEHLPEDKRGIYIVRNTGASISEGLENCCTVREGMKVVKQSQGIPLLYRSNEMYILTFDIFELIRSSLLEPRDDSININRPRVAELTVIFRECLEAVYAATNKTLQQSEIFKPGYIPTFDIDRYNYKFPMKTIYYRLMSLLGRKSAYLEISRKGNVWDNISELNEIIADVSRAIFFFMTVRKDRFARRYSSSQIPQMSDSIDTRHIRGIHLSYESGIELQRMGKEITRLKQYINNPDFARFHYLYEPQLSHYREMHSQGIKLDSSVGFTDRCGFKRGMPGIYAVPGTGVYELPVICMDSALKFAMLKGKDNTDKLLDEIEKFGGSFTFIFHQSALSEDTFPGYRDILNKFLTLPRERGWDSSDPLQLIAEMEQLRKSVTAGYSN